MASADFGEWQKRTSFLILVNGGFFLINVEDSFGNSQNKIIMKMCMVVTKLQIRSYTIYLKAIKTLNHQIRKQMNVIRYHPLRRCCYQFPIFFCALLLTSVCL